MGLFKGQKGINKIFCPECYTQAPCKERYCQHQGYLYSHVTRLILITSTGYMISLLTAFTRISQNDAKCKSRSQPGPL